MASFKRFIGKSFFKIKKWKLVGEVPDVPKYICIIAPHTSFWDMIYGKMFNWATDMEPKIMVKQEFFFFPVGPIIKMWGGIPINRQYPGGIVAQMAENFKNVDKMILAITPEGTRAANPNWKTGFYRIAVASDVPVYLSFIDFKTKKLGFIGEYKITGNMEEDMKAIKELYRNIEGLRKESFVI